MLKKKRIPIRGSIELNYRCNLRCVHCYIPEEKRKKSSDELSFDEVCRILDEIYKSGCLWLQLTGGELFLRSDFLDIYTYAKFKGFLVSIFTNGTLINSEIVDCLKELPPYCVDISLYGNTQKTYETITRRQGSYKKCINGINMLLEANIPTNLNTVIMTINKEEIVDMANYAKSLGVDFQANPFIIPRLDGSKEPCFLRVPPEKAVTLIDTINTITGKRANDLAYDGDIVTDNYFLCDAGVGSFHIDANGNMTNCIVLRKFSYNLRHGTFQEGWGKLLDDTHSFNLKHNYTDKYNINESYARCEHCPGWAYLEHGLEDVPIDYLCSLRRLQHNQSISSFQK